MGCVDADRGNTDVLCLDPSPSAMEFRCQATISGIDVPAADFRKLVGSKSTLRLVRELPLKPWVFFRFPVPEGRNEITISLEPANPETRAFEVQAGWWLWTEQPLQKATLTMEFDQDLPPAMGTALPFPSAMEVRRQVIPLQALKAFSFSTGSTR